MTTYLMAETVVEYTDGVDAGLIEVHVAEGEDCADVHVEDAEVGVDLRLDRDELRAMIQALEQALDLIEG